MSGRAKGVAEAGEGEAEEDAEAVGEGEGPSEVEVETAFVRSVGEALGVGNLDENSCQLVAQELTFRYRLPPLPVTEAGGE